MPTFTLRIFEQIGGEKSSQLRFLGSRETRGNAPGDGKQWLSELISQGRLEADRFYRFESSDCKTELRGDQSLHISFYLFADGRICPLRIWGDWEQGRSAASDNWCADFEGIPGWTFFASIEPRWRRATTIPAERWWTGRSSRDWQKRECWTIALAVAATRDEAA